ncbi:MAG: hypothetical protein QNJ05_09800 [Woeseiaceae bacterium]|nr:hypothetical protein [Woeseiaceae bacterium]
MMNQVRKLALALAPVFFFPVASADETVEAPAADAKVPEIQEVAENVLTETLSGLDAFESSATLSDDELGTQRAKEKIELAEITINDQEQSGDVTDNVAIGNTTGDNLIDGNAFSNSSGFLSTVQNSGNNVLIQSSTIINVSVDAPSN